MNPYHLQIKDYYSLVSLHKALLEAKFNLTPENEEISGSPLIADIYKEVISLLLQSDKASDWEIWLQLKNRDDYKQKTILRMKKCRQWKNAAPEAKRKIAQVYLVPFLYGEQELLDVIAAVDKISGKQE